MTIEEDLLSQLSGHLNLSRNTPIKEKILSTKMFLR